MESSLSVATSLKSENNLLPDENVYSRYDEAIAGIDDDLQTAVSHQEAKEEGRRASSAVSVGHFHHHHYRKSTFSFTSHSMYFLI